LILALCRKREHCYVRSVALRRFVDRVEDEVVAVKQACALGGAPARTGAGTGTAVLESVKTG